jgi:Trypsin-like peptidase domain
MKQKFLLLIAIGILFTINSTAQVRKTLEDNIIIKSGTTTTKTFARKQILLTNSAQFKGNRSLEGASGFLIKYNNLTYAVTARHVLGEEGGVEPEVKVNVLARNLISWEMSPRVVMNAETETVKLNANGLNFSKSFHDILLLNVASSAFDLEVLTPNFALPAAGETLYLIGCPYNETQCRQNTYAVTYIQYDAAEATLVCEIEANVELSGFSGAPLVNSKGEVVGVLVSGGESDGKTYIMATHIKEIQKIK